MIQPKRDSLLDALRGAAALGVVAIHTAFHSGDSYVPAWFQSLTLLWDVPLFFVLAGWSASFRPGRMDKTLKSLALTWCKWALFVLLLALVSAVAGLSGVSGARDLFQNLFFHTSFWSFPSVGYSVWFLPVYFRVSLLGQLALYLLGSRRGPRAYKLLAGTLAFLYLAMNANSSLLPGLSQMDGFYALLWCVGLLIGCCDWKLSSWKAVLALCALAAAGWYVSARMLQTGYALQQSKFPPQLPYLFASLPAIGVALLLRGRKEPVQSRLLVHIGQNALFYYFAQGVGSSALYCLKPLLPFQNWFVCWLCLLAANLAITALVAEALARLYRLAERAALGLWRRWPGRKGEG